MEGMDFTRSKAAKLLEMIEEKRHG